MPAAEHRGHRGPSADRPGAVPHDARRGAPAARGFEIAPTMAVWTGDCSMAVELVHVVGPVGGVIETPAHLVEHVPAGTSWDLDQTASKLRLYELCLTYGSCFEIYRCVNLAELARLWPLLSLPAGIRAQWTGALREVGLLPATARVQPAPAARPRRHDTAPDDRSGSEVNRDAALRA